MMFFCPLPLVPMVSTEFILCCMSSSCSKIKTNAKEFYANKGSQGKEKTDQQQREVRENKKRFRRESKAVQF